MEVFNAVVQVMRAGFIIVVLGGASAAAEEGCLKSIEISRNGEGFEMVDTKLLESRRSPSVFYQNENIVVVGGCRRRGEHLNSLEMFRIGGKSTLVPEVIKDGLSCSAFCQVQNGIGYVFGGFNKTGCHNLVYKINNGLVSRCPPLSTDLKNAAAVIARNNRAYIIGGWDGKRTLDTIFTYEDDKLLYETRLPYPVEGHSSSVFDEFIINVGGFDGVSVISTISIYDTITKRTLLVDAKLKTPRENHCTVIFKKDKKNVMLIMGGWDGQEALSECEAFELINESPFVIPIQWNCDLIEPRNRPAVVVVPTE